MNAVCSCFRQRGMLVIIMKGTFQACIGGDKAFVLGLERSTQCPSSAHLMRQKEFLSTLAGVLFSAPTTPHSSIVTLIHLFHSASCPVSSLLFKHSLYHYRIQRTANSSPSTLLQVATLILRLPYSFVPALCFGTSMLQSLLVINSLYLFPLSRLLSALEHHFVKRVAFFVHLLSSVIFMRLNCLAVGLVDLSLIHI